MSRKQKPQGHPGKIQDDLYDEVARLATRMTRLVPKIIRDPRLDPNDVIAAQACAVGLLHLYAKLDGKPTPYEIHQWEPPKEK